MNQLMDDSIYCSPLAPVASLDEILAGGPGDEDSPARDIVSREPTPEQILERHEASMAVAGFVGALPPRQREVVERVFWHGDTRARVARDLGISGAAVSKMLGRAMRQGKAYLAAYRECSLVN